MSGLQKLRELFGPYEKYPIAFVQYPHVNYLLDAIPKLLDIAEAAKAAMEEVITGNMHLQEPSERCVEVPEKFMVTLHQALKELERE